MPKNTKTTDTAAQKNKILIIDNDLTIKAMLEDMLRIHGHTTILHATNGRDGIRLVKEHAPDIILLDVVMPEMGGIGTCQAIRKMDMPVRPSIIMISDKGDKDAIVEALENGADDFIIKPVDALELIARIKAQSRIRDFYHGVYEDKKNLETILDIIKTISSMLKTNEVLSTIVNRVADITAAARCSIVLIANEDVGYVLASHEKPEIKKIKLDLNKYPEIKEAVKNRRPVVVENIAKHPLMAGVRDLVKDLQKMNELVLPIVWEDKVIGTIFLRTRRPAKCFTEKEINLCRIISSSACQAIKNARIFEDISKEKDMMKTLAVTDSLTELYNHGFFYTRLEEEFNRAVRYGTPISLIMMDLDDFKKINDSYGHRTGDHVLKEVAGLIKKLVRKTDMVARYGGEEFAVILPHTNIKGAEEEAERILAAILSHSYAHLAKETISMSIGVASSPCKKPITNFGDLVNFADTALYEAKRSGKNKVVVFGQK
ncbi:MAG: diguanylate cyclase [Deltaproteobacteria bacterium]|nr:diguanylate cyclase [Deltaproteobacteria bacterium]